MLAEINPLYMAFMKPDVVYNYLPVDTYECHDYNEDTIMGVHAGRNMTSLIPFTWSPYGVGSNFWDIIKNQVHIFPSLDVDFGLVLSQEEIPYYVWNAFTTQEAHVKEPITTGDFGTVFAFDTPGDFTLGAGKGMEGMLTVFVEGPVSSFTFFEIQVTVGTEPEPLIYDLDTKATRIIVFPFLADWSSPVKMSYKFETVISSDLKGKESRRPLYEKPKRTINFKQVDKINNLISNAINFVCDKSIGMPVLPEVFKITGFSTNKTTVHIRGSVDDRWNLKNYCDYICIYDLVTDLVVAKKIVSRSGSTIVVENPVLEVFSNPEAVIGFPLLIGYFKSAKPTIINGKLVEWDLELTELVGENQPPFVVPALPASLTNTFDWAHKVTLEPNLYRDIGGFTGTAEMIYAKYPYDKNPPRIMSGSFSFTTPQKLNSFLDFICSAKGRVRKFEYLWPLKSLEVIKEEYEGVNQLRVRVNSYADQFDKLVNKKIRLRYKEYVMNTSIMDVTKTLTYYTITLANPTTFRIFKEDLHRVYIEEMRTVRFDLDEFKFDYTTSKSVTTNIKLSEVL